MHCRRLTWSRKSATASTPRRPRLRFAARSARLSTIRRRNSAVSAARRFERPVARRGQSWIDVMERMPNPVSPKGTLLLILLPMLAAFVCQRGYLHLLRVQHVYPAGYLVHHLFTGSLLIIPAAFVLANGTRNRVTAVLARVILGIGSALVLDEVSYLVATQ